MENLKIVCISDTHTKHSLITIPECDILLHSGDFTFKGEPDELKDFAKWLEVQPADYIVCIPGNHEVWLEKNWKEGCSILYEQCPRLIILNDSETNVEGLTIWGSPITPRFGSGWAWNRNRGKDIQKHWDKIPTHVDILLTHGPVYGLLDTTSLGAIEEHCGCSNLLTTVQDRVKPELFVFGHLHEGHGKLTLKNTTYINASILDDYYNLSFEPTIMDI
jgi:Icc-related predicted phosphoesterase